MLRRGWLSAGAVLRQPTVSAAAPGWQAQRRIAGAFGLEGQRRSVQFSSDDRIPGLALPDRKVRKYQRRFGLSRSMDVEAEEACRLAERQLGIPNLELKPWIQWSPPKSEVLRYRMAEYVILHGSETLENKLTRKVECHFKPNDLGLSPEATANLVAICGTRYNKNKQVVKLTSDALETQEENVERIECMVAQLIYYAKATAGEKMDGEVGGGGGAKAEAEA